MVSMWRQHANTLVKELTAKGVLAPGWREAFAATPRHLFVPHFYDDDRQPISADTPEGLAAVYADESLVTQVAADPGGGLCWPTSSSTRPSLMAKMLTLLDVADGMRVLEIGTGTGYNAALLCRRLRDTNVTSIDIDPALVATAKARLADLGHRPFLAAGDAAAGVPVRAPYSRIIATAAVASIPPAWISQLTHGGKIVADMRGELTPALLVADKTTPTSVRGRFHDIPGHFTWLRARADHPLRDGSDPETRFDFTAPTQTTTDIPADAFDKRELRFLLQLTVPGLGPISKHLPDGGEGIFLHAADDCSWVQYRPGPDKATVTYGGPRDLWHAIEDTWNRWNHWQLPSIRRFGITANDAGRSHIWLDHDYAVIVTGEPVA